MSALLSSGSTAKKTHLHFAFSRSPSCRLRTLRAGSRGVGPMGRRLRLCGELLFLDKSPNRSIAWCRSRIHLGFQAITVFIKNIIHTSFGKAGFFIEAAVGLLVLIAGGANRHFFLLTEIDFQIRHYHHLFIYEIYFYLSVS